MSNISCFYNNNNPGNIAGATRPLLPTSTPDITLDRSMLDNNTLNSSNSPILTPAHNYLL